MDMMELPMPAESEALALLARIDERSRRLEKKFDGLDVMIRGDGQDHAGVVGRVTMVEEGLANLRIEVRKEFAEIRDQLSLRFLPESPALTAETWKAKALIVGAITTVILTVTGAILDILRILNSGG